MSDNETTDSYLQEENEELIRENRELTIKVLTLKLEVFKIENIKPVVSFLINKLNHDCSICLDKVCSHDYKVLRCHHIFHQSCIIKCSTCPLCREKLLLSDIIKNDSNVNSLFNRE